jgi:hypothetical protein
MRAKMLMVAVASAWLTLASSAGAGEFECKIPWWRSWAVQCGTLSPLRPGEAVTIQVISLKDDDGKDVGSPVYIEIVDTNTNKTVMEEVDLFPKTVTSYKNETKGEVIGRVNARYKHSTTVHLKVRYTIYR